MEKIQPSTEAIVYTGLATSTACHFLRIPAEIRLCIYRYLLIPEPEIELSEIASRKPDPSEIAEHTWVDEDEWEDEPESSDNGWSDEGCTCGMCPDYESGSDSDDESDLSSFEPTEVCKMYPEIFRVNRQIYQEASSLFHAEATLVLDSDDVLCLGKRTKNTRSPFFLDFETLVPPNTIWRYNPLKGIGKSESNGVVRYKSARLGGMLDPHVFARFQKIKFDTYFDQDPIPDFSIWIDDDTLVFNENHAAEYQKLMQHNPVIKDFVKIISNSQHISHLLVTLETDVIATSTAIERANMDDDNEDEDEEQEIEEKAEKTQEAANEKAAELLLDCDVFNPLLKLSNVQNFRFGFAFYHREPDNPFQPSPKHAEKISSMKALIESNFKGKDSSCRY